MRPTVPLDDVRVCEQCRDEILVRRTLARLHIVEGLLRSFDERSAITEAMEGAVDREDALERLTTAPFGFSTVQANHVLDMTWGRRTKAGRQVLLDEALALRRGEDTSSPPHLGTQTFTVQAERDRDDSRCGDP